MPHLQAYTERSKHLNFNGKSLVLADAVDIQSKDIGFPHRWPLKAGSCRGAAFSLLGRLQLGQQSRSRCDVFMHVLLICCVPLLFGGSGLVEYS